MNTNNIKLTYIAASDTKTARADLESVRLKMNKHCNMNSRKARRASSSNQMSEP